MEKASWIERIIFIMYPPLLYFVISMVTMTILGGIIGEDVKFYTLRQTIGAAVAIPFLQKMHQKDVLLFFVNTTDYTKKEKAGRALYAGICIACMGIALNNLIGLFPFAASSESYESLSEAFYGASVWVELIGLGIVIPYAEELLYRGLVFGRLKVELGAKKAIFVSALIFGIVHLNLVQFLYAFFMGLLLAWFADRMQSLWPAFLGHAFANCIAILRQEFHIFSFFEQNTVLYLVWTVLMFAVTSTLFGLQFRDKKVRA